MAANKPVIFDIKANIPVPQQQQQPVVQQQQPQLPVLEQQQPVQQQPVQQQKVEIQQEKPKKTNKPPAKNSNLGVALSMKKITKSPIPDVMPALLPNQPVQVLGQPNMAPVVNPNNTIQQQQQPPQQPIPINPAIKHPAAGNKPIEFAQNEKFKPETTHPAVLAQRQIIMNLHDNKSKKLTKKPTQIKSKTKKTTKKPAQKTINKPKSKITHKIFK
jgi:WNK lysine deficient protein kinase